LRKDSNAPQRERISEWVRLYRQSPLKYEMNALLSVLETDGEQMLMAVLKDLGLTDSIELVKDAAKRE
jgi:hypothetical protein